MLLEGAGADAAACGTLLVTMSRLLLSAEVLPHMRNPFLLQCSPCLLGLVISVRTGDRPALAGASHLMTFFPCQVPGYNLDSTEDPPFSP